MPGPNVMKSKDANGSNAAADTPTLAASIEITAAQIKSKPESLDLIPPGTRTYVVDLGNTGPEEWAALCRCLVDHGLEPVPHIAARRLVDRDALADRLAAMTQTAGVRDVLLIAGGPKTADGPFDNAMQVLECGLLDQFGVTRIGVAGHPEGLPVVPDHVVANALRWKQEFANRSDAEMRVVTQFGFDTDGLLRWARALEQDGVSLPVHLGVAGPASVTSLLKYAALCGVGESTRFLARNSTRVTSLLTNHSPEPYVKPVEEHVAANQTSLLKQFHVFPFGGIAKSAEWLCERGSWKRDARDALDAMSKSASRLSQPETKRRASGTEGE